MTSKSKNNIRLREASEKYLSRITNEGQAEKTIYTARHTLARLLGTIGTKKEPDPWVHLISAQVIEEYCFGAGGIRVGVQAVSFNRYRSVLVKFFEYAELMEWTNASPMKGVAKARGDAPTPKLLLSATELVALLESTGNPIERIACSIGMNTALRANDVRHLTVFDANLNNGTIQTEIRKTRKLDDKPITMDMHNELVRWLNTYAQLMGLESRDELPNDFLLVPSYRLRAPREILKSGSAYILRPMKVLTHPWRLVQRPLARIGYPTKGEGFHTLRRSSARALFESLRSGGEGRDHALMIVKEYLNHSSTAQTEHYLGLNHERTIRDSLLKGKSFLSRLASDEQEKQGTLQAGEDKTGGVGRG